MYIVMEKCTNSIDQFVKYVQQIKKIKAPILAAYKSHEGDLLTAENVQSANISHAPEPVLGRLFYGECTCTVDIFLILNKSRHAYYLGVLHYIRIELPSR